MESFRASEFPNYGDGDVAIVVTPQKTYQLHSGVLRRYSHYFADVLAEEAAANLSTKAKKDGITIRYRLQLVKTQFGAIGTFHRLVSAQRHPLNILYSYLSVQSVDNLGRSPSAGFSLTGIDNGRIPDERLQYWDWLFGIFYGKAPTFDDENLATVLSGCMGLVDVAETVQAVDSVREVVDLALLRQGSVLWNSVASNPIAWAELGRRVHSPTIFKEGIVHIVGKWNDMADSTKKDLHPDIRALCERKYRELEIAKEAIELRILGHYPAFLCRDAANKPGRATYSNDIYMWMAICFYRQWFAQAISDGRNRVARDGGYEFYHQIGQAGQAYLSHETFLNFHKYFPMSSKACNVLEANMGILKKEVRHFVHDILQSNVNVDGVGYPPLRWLTCVKVTKEDYPWHVEEPETLLPTNSFAMTSQSPDDDKDDDDVVMCGRDRRV
jgi:hypothetical protein